MRGEAEVAERKTLFPVVGKAAGLGAGAAIAAPSADERTEQALPGMRDAERAVQKDLGLGRRVFRDRHDLGEREFPRQNDAARAEPREQVAPLGRMGGRLRTGVDRQIGVAFGDPRDQPRVRNDQGVDAEFPQFSRALDGALPFALGEQGVQRDVRLRAVQVAVDHRPGDLFVVEVAGEGAGVQTFAAEVDRVGSRVDRGDQRRKRSGGGKQFRKGAFSKHDPSFRLRSGPPKTRRGTVLVSIIQQKTAKGKSTTQKRVFRPVNKRRVFHIVVALKGIDPKKERRKGTSNHCRRAVRLCKPDFIDGSKCLSYTVFHYGFDTLPFSLLPCIRSVS